MPNRLERLFEMTPPDESWAATRWRRWEAQNRFLIRPINRAHQKGKWPQDWRDHYAALFPKAEIGTFLDFVAYEFFHSSILQNVVANERNDGSWFRLESLERYTQRLLAFLNSQREVLTPESLAKWLRAWELPERINWITELTHRHGLVRDDASEATLWSETDEGYLVLLVING